MVTCVICLCVDTVCLIHCYRIWLIVIHLCVGTVELIHCYNVWLPKLHVYVLILLV